MAKALQCPDCGNRHPLDQIGAARTFRCESCSRLLKVPKGIEVGGNGVSPSGSAAAKTAAQAKAKVPPSQRVDAVIEPARSRPPRTPSRVPRALRVLVWLVAIPLGIVPILVVGRATGVLNLDLAANVYLGVGWGRFVPLLVMLPLWAGSTATIAHFSIEALGRMLSGGRAAAGA